MPTRAFAKTHNVAFFNIRNQDFLVSTIDPHGVVNPMLDIEDRNVPKVDQHSSAGATFWCSGSSPPLTQMLLFRIMYFPEQNGDELKIPMWKPSVAEQQRNW